MDIVLPQARSLIVSGLEHAQVLAATGHETAALSFLMNLAGMVLEHMEGGETPAVADDVAERVLREAVPSLKRAVSQVNNGTAPDPLLHITRALEATTLRHLQDQPPLWRAAA